MRHCKTILLCIFILLIKVGWAQQSSVHLDLTRVPSEKAKDALQLAIDNCDFAAIKAAIAQGASIHSVFHHDLGKPGIVDVHQNALIYSMRCVGDAGDPVDRFQIPSYFVQQGADVNFKDYLGDSPLMVLMQQNQDDQPSIQRLAAKLIAYGADINARNKHDMSALMFAVLYGSNDGVLLLLRYHPNLEYKFYSPDSAEGDDLQVGDTALMIAAEKSTYNILIPLLLLRHGAHVNIINARRQIPLFEAVNARSYAVTDALLQHGAHVTVDDLNLISKSLSHDVGDNDLLQLLLKHTNKKTKKQWQAQNKLATYV